MSSNEGGESAKKREYLGTLYQERLNDGTHRHANYRIVGDN